MARRFALSNIALPSGDHAALLPAVAAMGINGIEVAPSRIWSDPWTGLGAAQVAAYRRAIEAARMKVVGVHSFFHHPKPPCPFRGDPADQCPDPQFFVRPLPIAI